MTLMCKAPWAHYHVKEKGDMMLCCFFKGESSSVTSFEEYWNSDYMKNHRLMFLKNELPTVGCSKCMSTNFTRANVIEAHTLMTEEQIRANTLPDGTTTLLPDTIDVRIDLCNLKCITCHYYSSSRWATHDHVERELVGVFGQPVPDEILRTVNTAEWAGGEPFMSKVHFDALERLISMGRAKEVSLAYVTNGTFPGHTFKKSMKLLKEFKHVTISISIDGVGDVGEFIRDGWLKSDIEAFEKIRAKLSNVTLTMGVTVTSLGLVHLKDTIQFAQDHKIEMFFHKVSTFPDNSFLDLNLVKPEEFRKIISELREINIPNLTGFLNLLERYYCPREWNAVDEASWLRRGMGSQHPEVFQQSIKFFK